MTNGEGEGVELENCDALLAELGLSPMPKGLFSRSRVSPGTKPSGLPAEHGLKKRKSRSPKGMKARTPPARRPHSSARPSPLRAMLDVANETTDGAVVSAAMAGPKPPQLTRDSLYRRLFQMQPKSHHEDKKKKGSIPAILKVGADLLPAKSVKPLTVPREFHFASCTRPKKQPSTSSVPGTAQPSVPSASARPRPAGLGKKEPTKPVSPKLTRRREMVLPRDFTQMPASLKRPVFPSTTTRFTVSALKKTTTVPRSPKFSLIKKRRPVGEPEAAVEPFVARPVPSFAKVFQPVKPHAHTQPKEMHLPGDEIREAKRQKLQDRIEHDAELDRRQREFHARPAPPMSPKTSTRVTPRPSTVPHPPHFATEDRLVQRLNHLQVEEKENQSSTGGGRRPVTVRKMTRPTSPKFSTSERTRSRKQQS